VELDNLWFEVISFVLIVPVRCYTFVSECKTKRCKTDVLWEDIEQKAEGVMENEKKLPYAAALFALNRSAAFCRMQKARTKLGNVEYNVSSIQAL